MRNIGKQSRRLAALAMAAVLAPLPLHATAVAAAGPQTEEQRVGGDFSLEAFKQPYDRLMTAVDSGRLDREMGQKATALWLSLREELLALNARVASLKLDVKQREGAAQERALQELTQVAAARERVLGRHVRALEDLARTVPVGGARPVVRGGGITIDFVPADALNSTTN